MKINRQFQALHSPDPDCTDWHTVQIVERDICLLYHQLADYSYVMGDLYYGDIYSLPYCIPHPPAPSSANPKILSGGSRKGLDTIR